MKKIWRSKQWKKSSSGYALIMALSILVLLAVVTLAFFFRAALNRKIVYSSTNQARADYVGRFATDMLSSEILREIRDRSELEPPLYIPLTPQDAALAKVGVENPDALGEVTLAKISGNGLPVRPGGQAVGSSVSVDSTSLNGRYISRARWFATGGPDLGSQEQLPTWVYLSRQGTAGSPSPQNGRDKDSPEYTIGRFAYTVYDTSGLLNAAVAGHPQAAAGVAGGKSGVMDVNLAALDPENAGAVAVAQRFAEWRNGLADTQSAEAWRDYLEDFGYPEGFKTVKLGHNTFLSRRDLLNAVEAGVLTPEMARYMVTFSKNVEGPLAGPGRNSNAMETYYGGGSTVPRAYADNATQTNAINPLVSSVRAVETYKVKRYADDGTFVEEDINVGDPVLDRRFSLAKLAWLTPDGPGDESNGFHASLTPVQRADAIYNCFGLRWDTSGEFPRWVYDHGDPENILTLHEASTEEKRLPDFFEILKAGILNGPSTTAHASGSLGRGPGKEIADPGVGSAPLDQEGPFRTGVTGALFDEHPTTDPDFHILQLGANIIDQADTDSYPTAIYFNYPGNKAAYSAAVRQRFFSVYGVENLPYLERLVNPVQVLDGEDIVGWWAFALWNPHRRPVVANVDRPDTFRVRAYGRTRTSYYFDPGGGGTPPEISQEVDYESGEGLNVRDLVFTDDGNKFYEKPKRLWLQDVVESETSPQNYWREGQGFPVTTNKVAGIFAGKIERSVPLQSAPHYPSSGSGTKWFNPHSSFLSPNTFVLECRDRAGRWRPVSLMARQMAFYRNSFGLPGGVNGDVNGRTTNGRFADPRSDRFSTAVAELNMWPIDSTGMINHASQTERFRAFRSALPRPSYGIYFVNTANPPRFLGNEVAFAFMAWNRSDLIGKDYYNRNCKVFHTDPDGVVRPADGFRQDITASEPKNTLLLPGSGSHDSTIHAKRPVILDRPFASVAELGYVFRDISLKSLDFWSPSSADAGLLDLFTVREEPAVTVGKININTAPERVLAAMLEGTSYHATDSVWGRMSQAQANAMATKIADYLKLQPLVSRADLVTSIRMEGTNTYRLADEINTTLTASFDGTQFRLHKGTAEAPIRALANATDTRTWNLLIDVIAQAGRLSPNAGALKDFMVEGEKRYWLHVSIDRWTGKVLGSQLEVVHE